jgi:hypothetical protein
MKVPQADRHSAGRNVTPQELLGKASEHIRNASCMGRAVVSELHERKRHKEKRVCIGLGDAIHR